MLVSKSAVAKDLKELVVIVEKLSADRTAQDLSFSGFVRRGADGEVIEQTFGVHWKVEEKM